MYSVAHPGCQMEIPPQNERFGETRRTMSLPGFAANASLYGSMSEYRTANICNAAISAGLYPAAILPSQQIGKPLDPCIAALLACSRYGWQATCSYHHSRRCQPLPPPQPFCNYRGKRGVGQCQDDCYNKCVQQLNPNHPIHSDEVSVCYGDCSSCCNNYKNCVPLM